jgi:DNA topoisomerase-2
LILCEGDSAKSGIISGLSNTDRDYIGVFPLKGKLLNPRDKTDISVDKNEEIKNIKKILGLEYEKEYKTMADVQKYLNYGKVLIMTDQDLDGSHIKGLCINLIHCYWSSLIKIPGFISFMNTPLLKASLKNKKTLAFYNENEYQEWASKTANSNKYTIKYYKGLGSSKADEFKEYFKNKKIVGLNHIGDSSDDNIRKAFDKSRIQDRKRWLENYERKDVLNTTHELISYDDFINKELIHFSKYDCERSIPHMLDGLKISNRKILFAAFKKGLTEILKVAQFSGYVSEKTSYHHGEVSLQNAIINMAQNHVGSNNINLLDPDGQFGTRLQNGKDFASPRYIFTKLNEITRKIFREEDDPILDYLEDDGSKIEPRFYIPIIPMILVNGSSGIGTGFSTEIPCYNPVEIINYLLNKLSLASSSDSSTGFIPYYRGFKGKIEPVSEKKFTVDIPIKINKDKEVVVYELPLATSIEKYKEFLEDSLDDKTSLIKSFDNNSSEIIVNFTIEFKEPIKQDFDLKKYLKLTESISTNNIHAFNVDDKLSKYNNVKELIDEYYQVRLHYYTIRKQYQIKDLEKTCNILQNKANYIAKVIKGTIDLRNKSNEQIDNLLESLKFDKQDDSFDYLLDMKMRSVSKENSDKIKKQFEDKNKELEVIRATTETQMWVSELNQLLAELSK